MYRKMEKSLGFIAFDLDGVLSSQICRDKYIHHSLDCTDDVDVNNTNRFNDIIKYAKEYLSYEKDTAGNYVLTAPQLSV